MKKIILASASPRRRQLMAQAGFTFETVVSQCEEIIEKMKPDETVKELSKQKAEDVAAHYEDDCIIIGADTVVAYENEILGKPVDEIDALRMLRMLQGHTHQVYTGVTIIEGNVSKRKITSFAVRTDVTMYAVSDEDLLAYIMTGDPMDKAGAYGIQGYAAVFIAAISGDYNNVVGLPISAIWQHINGNKGAKHAAL